MSFRTTYILFGILIAQLIAFGLSQVFSSRPGDEMYILPELHRANVKAGGKDDMGPKGIAKDIDRVEIDRGSEGKIVFVREEGTKRWKMTEPYAAAIENDEAVNNIIDQLINARKEDKVEMQGKTLANTGLDSPKTKVTLTRTDGTKWTLNIGNKHEVGERNLYYANSSDLPKDVLALRQSNIDSLFKTYTLTVKGPDGKPLQVKDLSGKPKDVTRNETRWKVARDFRSRDLVTPSSMTLLSVGLNDGKNTLDLKREDDVTKWKFVKPDYGSAEYEPAGGPPVPPSATPPVNSVRALLSTLEGLKVNYEPDDPEKKVVDFVADNVPADKMGEYGLAKDKPAFMRINFERRLGGLLGGDTKAGTVKDELLVGKEVPSDTAGKIAPEFGVAVVGLTGSVQSPAALLVAAVSPAGKPDTKGAMRYARLASEDNVVKISANAVEQLAKITADPSDLRNRDLAQLDDTKVDAIDIKKYGGGHLKLRKVDGVWKLWDGTDKGVTADKTPVNLLLSDLLPSKDPNRRHLVESFPKEDAKDSDLGLDEKERTGEITLWEDGLDDTAKKEGKEPEKDAEPKLKEKPAKKVTLIFGKGMPDKFVNVIRDAGDKKVRVTIPSARLDALNDDRLAYFDKTLAKLNPQSEVIKFTLTQKDKAKDEIELVQEKKGDKQVWVFKKPEALAGRVVNHEKLVRVLTELSDLRADKLVAQKPADEKEKEKWEENLKNWGLKPAEVMITVTVKKNDKENDEYTYLFGKVADKDEKRYARIETKPESLGGRDLVFVMQPQALNSILDQKLADPTVLDFSPAKIKEIKLVGWKSADGPEKTLKLEREGAETGKWKVLEKPDDKFDLDTLNLDLFLSRLAHLRAADDFLEYKFKDQSILLKYGLGKEKKNDVEVDQRELQITFTFQEDQKREPLVLTIGKYLEDKKGYAAMSSTLPGDVFLIPKSALPTVKGEDLKEKDLIEATWKYFSK